MSARDTAGMIITLDQVEGWRERAEMLGAFVVATNGCFDLIHAGHVRFLEAARRQAGVARLRAELIVGLNSDAAVRELKGDGRPVNCAADRAFVLAALQSVDCVVHVDSTKMDRFLLAARPNLYVKSDQLSLDTMDEDERQILMEVGADIRFVPSTPGISTTVLIERAARLLEGANQSRVSISSGQHAAGVTDVCAATSTPVQGPAVENAAAEAVTRISPERLS